MPLNNRSLISFPIGFQVQCLMHNTVLFKGVLECTSNARPHIKFKSFCNYWIKTPEELEWHVAYCSKARYHLLKILEGSYGKLAGLTFYHEFCAGIEDDMHFMK